MERYPNLAATVGMYIYSLESVALVRGRQSHLDDPGCYSFYGNNELSAQETQLILLLDSNTGQIDIKAL